MVTAIECGARLAGAGWLVQDGERELQTHRKEVVQDGTRSTQVQVCYWKRHGRLGGEYS
jgi:hypothetical protein